MRQYIAEIGSKFPPSVDPRGPPGGQEPNDPNRVPIRDIANSTSTVRSRSNSRVLQRNNEENKEETKEETSEQ